MQCCCQLTGTCPSSTRRGPEEFGTVALSACCSRARRLPRSKILVVSRQSVVSRSVSPPVSCRRRRSGSGDSARSTSTQLDSVVRSTLRSCKTKMWNGVETVPSLKNCHQAHQPVPSSTLEAQLDHLLHMLRTKCACTERLFLSLASLSFFRTLTHSDHCKHRITELDSVAAAFCNCILLQTHTRIGRPIDSTTTNTRPIAS